MARRPTSLSPSALARRGLGPLLVAGLVLLAAGCGGGGSTAATPGTPTEPGTPAAPPSVQDGYQAFRAGTPTLTWSDAQIRAQVARADRTYTHQIEGSWYWNLDGATLRTDPLVAAPSPCEEGDCAFGDLEYEAQPFMTHNGVPVVRMTYQVEDDGPEITLITGWLDHHMAGGVFVGDAQRYAASMGRPSGSNPPVPSIAGGVTWSGVMIGSDVSDTDAFGNLVMGDATIRVEDLRALAADISFTRIWDLEASTAREDMTWTAVPVVDGVFTDGTASDTATITGSFYGPEHEEVGGVFDRDGISGAFGAKRD